MDPLAPPGGAGASRASDLARARLARKREREKQKAMAEQAEQSMSMSNTSEEPSLVTPSATESSLVSAYGQPGSGSGSGFGSTVLNSPTIVVDPDAANHLAYIQEKDPFASFIPTLPTHSTSTSISGLSRTSSLRPSIDTAASIHHVSVTNRLAAQARRTALRPDQAVGIEEEMEWGEEEDTLDKVGEVELPPLPTHFQPSSRLALHTTDSRTSSTTHTSKSRRWDPHAKREREKSENQPADFAVVKPDGFSVKNIGLDATFQREKRREDRKQMAGRLFRFGRKDKKGEDKGRERWEDELEGRSTLSFGNSVRDSMFSSFPRNTSQAIHHTTSKISLTPSGSSSTGASSSSRPAPPKGILKTRPPPLPLKSTNDSLSSNSLSQSRFGDHNASTGIPTISEAPPSASTITSQTSLRPTPKSFNTPTLGSASISTPATSVWGSGSSGSGHGHPAQTPLDQAGSAELGKESEKQDKAKAYTAHRQSLPWGKAIPATSPIIPDPPALPPSPSKPESQSSTPHAYRPAPPPPIPSALPLTHATPDFSRPAAGTPDSYKYSPTAAALIDYYTDGRDTPDQQIQPDGPTGRDIQARLAFQQHMGTASVDSTPGREIDADRLFYKAPKPSTSAFTSVVNTPMEGLFPKEGLVPPNTGLGIGMGMSMSGGMDKEMGISMVPQASSSSCALPLEDANTVYGVPDSTYVPVGQAISTDDLNRSPSMLRTVSRDGHRAHEIVRSSSSSAGSGNGNRPSAMYDLSSTSHDSATAEGLIQVALKAGESIWDPRIYLLAVPASPRPGQSGSTSVSYAERRNKHWKAYDHPIFRSLREKDKLLTFDELAFGKVGWREWVWPVPPNKPEIVKKGWRRKNRRHGRKAARSRKMEREAQNRNATEDKEDDDEEEEDEEEELLKSSVWSKVNIDGRRASLTASSPHKSPLRARQRENSDGSAITDLASRASRLEIALQTGHISPSSALSSDMPYRRESESDERALNSSASRHSFASGTSEYTVRSAGSGSTVNATRRPLPAPTPPPAGPLPKIPSSVGIDAEASRLQRAGSAGSGSRVPIAQVQSASTYRFAPEFGARQRSGSFGAGSALLTGRFVQPTAAERIERMRAASGSASNLLDSSGVSTPKGAVGLDEESELKAMTPAERRLRMRGKRAAMGGGAVDLAGEIKQIEKDREAELAALEEPIDEDRPRRIRFAGVAGDV